MQRSRQRRPSGVDAKLAKLTKYFAEEMVSRDWGDDEYRKLLAESRAAGEKVADHEPEMTRHVLAALDRVSSILVGSECAIEILADGGSAVPPRVLRHVLDALRDQAGHATSDAFAALKSAAVSNVAIDSRVARLPFRKAAAALTGMKIRAGDLRTPRALRGALLDALVACILVERGLELVQRLVDVDGKARRRLEPHAVSDVFTFLRKVAAYARGILTGGVASGIEGKVGQRPPARRMA
jgi:hypothetical protein